jgi:DNA-binding MarR family transcriptional regulator
VLKRRRISLTQFLVLDAITASRTSMRMAELAHAAGLPSSELTRVVSELEAKKWVERTTDPEDNRARLARATPAGARLIRTVHAQATAELSNVWSDFTHDEWHRFIDYLQRFERALDRARERSGRRPG